MQLQLTTLQNIKNGIEGHAVDWYKDVFDIVFPDIDPAIVNKQWKEQLKETDKNKKEKKRKSKKDEEDSDSDDD